MALPELESLPELPPPYEILELKPGETRRLTVVRWGIGRAVIHPRFPGAPREKTVRVIRMWVPEEEKPLYPHYWDATAGTLVPQLYAILRDVGVPPHKAVIEITKVGAPPKARFSVRLVEVIP